MKVIDYLLAGERARQTTRCAIGRCGTTTDMTPSNT
jgi:hypothetical protein